MLTRRTMIGSTLAGGLLLPRMAMAADKFIVCPISVEDHKIWVAVSIEKQKPELFFIDTGASHNVLSDKWATALKLRTSGFTRSKGIGGIETGDVLKVRNVSIGGALDIGELDFAASKTLDKGEAKGLLAAAFLAEFDSDLDFAKSQWRIYPDGRTDRTGLYQIPDSYEPIGETFRLAINGTVGPLQGRFQVDTGAPGTLLLDGRASKKMDLWDSGQPYVPNTSRGFGPGSVPSRMYRVDRIKLHKFALEKQFVTLMRPGETLGQFQKFDGLIGMRSLRHFDISTDRKNKCLWMKPNGMNFDDENRYPMSGIWAQEEKGKLEIVDVGIGSPAEKAGLKAGDIVIGKQHEAFRTELYGAAGNTIAFEYERGGKRSKAEFVLQPYL